MKNAFFLVFLVSFLSSCKKEEIPLTDNTPITIPDSGFEDYLVYLNIDSDRTVNGSIKYGDIKSVDTLRLIVTAQRPTIKNLKGIAYFTNLKYLDCTGWAIDQLDVSQNPNLEFLNCSTNPSAGEGYYPPAQISQLLFGKANNKLKILHCNKNLIRTLDLTTLPSLTQLFCTGSLLTELDVSHNKNLTTCWTTNSPQLKTIYVSSLNQVDSTRSQDGGTIGGSYKWFKDAYTIYKVR
ncbi:hypothetical protein GO730_02715 [Spirosoma sp. HMF3257]|uniref:Leucine-rich repeat domain-containing protein n=1 Tax=Spirosoma telluris TaxID=2183553 RepID=A0A327NE75_9BACT|nr:hypothetical protein [Spirosoma telluris]RAI73600.1 hypothetical protein HMF3257_02655 [Spirosoma telluris]